MRFKEFSEEWEKYRCSDFLINFPTNSLSWEMLSYDENAQIYNLHYGLIHNGAPTLINTENYKLPSVKNENVKSQEKIENGDVIFADASEDTAEIGKCIEFIGTNNQIIYSGLHTIHTRDVKNLTVIGFKAFLFQSNYFHKQVERIAQGTKIYSLNFTNFKELYVNIPNKKEQQKIATFLTLIDKRIETQMKIIEEYKSLIKGIREKIFNNLSQTKSYNFIELFEEYKDLNNDILDQYTIGKYGIKQLEQKNEKYNISKHIVFYPDSCILGVGIEEIGISLDISGCCSPIYKTYKINNNYVITKYFYYFINYYFMQYKNKVTQKSTRRNYEIDYKTLKTIFFDIPSLNNQKQVVLLLDILFRIHTNESNLLNLYKLQKEFLLDNLFI